MIIYAVVAAALRPKALFFIQFSSIEFFFAVFLCLHSLPDPRTLRSSLRRFAVLRSVGESCWRNQQECFTQTHILPTSYIFKNNVLSCATGINQFQAV